MNDRDHLYAIIIASALNNDGSRKNGFAVPGIEGMKEVINTAYRVARISPESISYIEAHGTGTPLGDLIELEALKQAFGSTKKQFCAIGSVKTNVGHLSAAVGITGFIKTVLALKHRLIPPSLHFETPNPAIDFENSPFYVATKLQEWKNNQYPLRAGINAFGIGGTNVHMVLEAAAAEKKRSSPSLRVDLVVCPIQNCPRSKSPNVASAPAKKHRIEPG